MIFNPDRHYIINYIAQNEDGSQEIVEEPFLYFAKMFVLERKPIIKNSVHIYKAGWKITDILFEDGEGNMVSVDGVIYYTIDYEKGILYNKDYDVDSSDY